MDLLILWRRFFAKGADVNTGDKNGATPLMLACGNGLTMSWRCFLAKGADVNAKTNDGSTPLKLAAESGNAKVKELLVKAGAK